MFEDILNDDELNDFYEGFYVLYPKKPREDNEYIRFEGEFRSEAIILKDARFGLTEHHGSGSFTEFKNLEAGTVIQLNAYKDVEFVCTMEDLEI